MTANKTSDVLLNMSRVAVDERDACTWETQNYENVILTLPFRFVQHADDAFDWQRITYYQCYTCE